MPASQLHQHLRKASTEMKAEDADAEAEAGSLRARLDHLIERFRGDAAIDALGSPLLVREVRAALEEEFAVLISRHSEDVLRRAVLMTHDESRRLPIHLACDKNAPAGVLRTLLEADAGKRSIMVPDKWGDLPLHTACSRHRAEVVRLLVDSDASKGTLYAKADNGSLPIHAAVRYCAPPGVVTLLLESGESRSTLLEPDAYGQLPLHAACRNGAHPDVIDLLLKHDEDGRTLLRVDKVGRLPVHLALLHTTNQQIEVVQLLLQGMLCGRMANRGLDLWKADMRSLLRSMETHERDFTTRDKLDMICEAVRVFMERVHALELAVWRASCLRLSGGFASLQDASDHESSLAFGSVDACAYKANCRIRSGDDVIVRDVIPFLENEPVEELVHKFRNY